MILTIIRSIEQERIAQTSYELCFMLELAIIAVIANPKKKIKINNAKKEKDSFPQLSSCKES